MEDVGGDVHPVETGVERMPRDGRDRGEPEGQNERGTKRTALERRRRGERRDCKGGDEAGGESRAGTRLEPDPVRFLCGAEGGEDRGGRARPSPRRAAARGGPGGRCRRRRAGRRRTSSASQPPLQKVARFPARARRPGPAVHGRRQTRRRPIRDVRRPRRSTSARNRRRRGGRDEAGSRASCRPRRAARPRERSRGRCGSPRSPSPLAPCRRRRPAARPVAARGRSGSRAPFAAASRGRKRSPARRARARQGRRARISLQEIEAEARSTMRITLLG